MSQHNKFILTPVSKIFSEAIWAVQCIGHGIETFPVSNYVMQSVFIRMTGAQEQKMKCISWELANNDFDFRFKFLREYSSSGFSTYKEKNTLYKELIEQIQKVIFGFGVNDLKGERSSILEKATIDNIVSDVLLYKINHKEYSKYKDVWSDIKDSDFLQQNTVLLQPKPISSNSKKEGDDKKETDLQDIYKVLYENRNRIAHNTKSYQHNLPTLNSLLNDNYKYENYFLWFSILILIDEVFMKLYQIYLDTLETKKFI